MGAPDFDDGGWRALPATDELREGEPVSWFRRELDVGESVSGREVGLYLELRGAAQLFLDGELLFDFGRLPPPAGVRVAGAERGRAQTCIRNALPKLHLPPSGRHTLAMRYDRRSHLGFDWWTPAWGFVSRSASRPR